MNIAIDYDGTYTKDPEMWLSIIDMMKLRGHYVMCVTFRYDNECINIDKRLYDKVNAFIATGRRAKFNYLEEQKIDIDIWIDDDPLTITGHHPATIK